MTDSKTTDPAALRGAAALVRAGSPDPATSTPDGDHPQCPQQQNPETTPTAVGDIGGLSPNPSAPGPKTEAGKSRSSQNATTHGLRAKKLANAVAPDMRHQYEKLRRQYLDDYRPTGAIENTLFDMLVFAAWQLYKIRDLEMFTDLDLGMPGSFGRSEKLARYRGSHERLLFRSLNQLKQMQQERALLAADRTAQLPAHIPPGVKLKPLFNHLKTLHRHPKTRTASASAPKPELRKRRERGSSPSLRLELTRS